MVDLQDFAEHIAAKLTTTTEQWMVDPDTVDSSWYRNITTGTGEDNEFALHLKLDGHLRVQISPVPPIGRSLSGSRYVYDSGKPMITVNGERPIESIVNDIRRRLLGTARVWWEQNVSDAIISLEARSRIEIFQQTLLTFSGAEFVAGGFSTIVGPNYTISTDRSPRTTSISFDNLTHAQVIQLLDYYYQHILDKQGDSSHGR